MVIRRRNLMPTTIHADESQHLIMIGSLRLEGWIEEPPCPRCASPRIYWVAYDATFCPTCNRWLELRCDDPGCTACRVRPPTPLAGARADTKVRGAA
jgi:hypothetical protein